jgi:GNAT superfamily N-acetyltransferase
VLIRGFRAAEIPEIAEFIARGYDSDAFFHWCVDNDPDQTRIVTEYYQVYLRAEGCICNLAVDDDGAIIGATVWLPHDVDPAIYDEIYLVTEMYERQFSNMPFYQLVGVVVDKHNQGQGIGTALMQYQFDKFDSQKVPTYLEASTEFTGGGLYGKFGYAPYGEIMSFEDHAYLYPLFREVPDGVRDIP